MDEQQIDEVNDNDGSLGQCKCGCENPIGSFGEVSDNDGYIWGHENE